MTSVREQSARALGRATAGHVIAARAARNSVELRPLLEAQLGEDGVDAVGVYDAKGALVANAGEPAASDALPTYAAPGAEQVSTVNTNRGAALLVAVPSDSGSVAALV